MQSKRYIYYIGFGFARVGQVLSEIFVKVALGHTRSSDTSRFLMSAGSECNQIVQERNIFKQEVHILYQLWFGARRPSSERDIHESSLGPYSIVGHLEIPRVDRIKTQLNRTRTKYIQARGTYTTSALVWRA
jgi:hypothetical protein